MHLILLLLAATPAFAQDPLFDDLPEDVEVEGPATADTLPIGFTRLVVRDDQGRLLGAAPEEYRIRFLEELRRLGFDVRGADDLLFGVDTSAEAVYLLGGTLMDIQQRWNAGHQQVEVTIEWKVLDTRLSEVVYTVVTRGDTTGDTRSNLADLADTALFAALRSLTERPKFLDAISQGEAVGDELPPAEWDAPLVVAQCPIRKLPLPDSIEAAIDAVTVVSSTSGSGSGVVVSPDGFVLTAAHVLPRTGEVTVTLRSGAALPATPVRVDPLQDLAILKVDGSDLDCLTVEGIDPKLGTELYAVGSPGGSGLEFSVSKGVVSGVRSFSGWRYLQTDASINPGNSGGPLLDARSRVVAVVSFKVAAPGFEGLGFGVPAAAIVDRLGVVWGATSSTDLALLSGRTGGAPTDVEPIIDLPDPSRLVVVAPAPAVNPLNPTAPPRKTSKLGALGGGGIALALGGAGAVLGTYGWYLGQEHTQRGTWGAMVALNTVGWLAFGGGVSMLVVDIVWVDDQPRILIHGRF